MKPVKAADFYKKRLRTDRILTISLWLTLAAIFIVIGYGFYEYKIWEYFK